MTARRQGHSKKAATGAAAFSEADGRELAVEMLRALDSAEVCDACALDPVFRPGIPNQANLVLPYMQSLIERNDPALTAGFASVLTDFASCALGGCSPNVATDDEMLSSTRSERT